MRELLSHYRDHAYKRIAATTRISFVMNILVGVGKLVLGVYLFSSWFVVNAFYHLLLCVARGQALRQLGTVDGIENPQKRHKKEFGVFRQNGSFICLIGIVYLLICLHMCLSGHATAYNNDYVVYGVAAVAFAKISFAVAGVISKRKQRRPILTAIKVISFLDACVSVVLTQCAILVMMKSDHAIASSALLGMVVSMAFILAGLGMLLAEKPA